MWAKVSQWYQDAEETQHMDDENGALDLRKQACKDGVHEDAEANDGMVVESTMPPLKIVTWIVQHQHTLDLSATNEGNACERRLP